MKHTCRVFLVLAAAVWFALSAISTAPVRAQSKSDQWIHVRVECKDEGGETVRVNVPLDMAVKVLPAINHDQLQNGKVRIHDSQLNDVDLHVLLDAVRSAKDGEYVTVQGHDNNVRVAKNGGYLYVHVTDKGKRDKEMAESSKEKHGKMLKNASQVEVKVPMKVVDALLSGGKDELDLVAALHALSLNGDTELVTVKDDENTVHIWVDSKNISD
jgi:WD40 repeat protein